MGQSAVDPPHSLSISSAQGTSTLLQKMQHVISQPALKHGQSNYLRIPSLQEIDVPRTESEMEHQKLKDLEDQLLS